MIRILILMILAVALTACGSAPPAPAERFYRLQPVKLSPAGKPAEIVVLPFRADSLYAERPLVYGDAADPRQLRQYHYHLWLYAPPQLVREHLAASLGRPATGSGARLEGRVLRFDRMLAGKHSQAVVTLELLLTQGGKELLRKTYTAEQPAADDSVAGHVLATEQALVAIYTEFLRDFGR